MKYFIFLQYDGTDYHGWQTQPDAVTVQETIEQKLSMLLRRDIFIVGAGRTDAGVHARQMVAHFVLADPDPTPALPREGEEKTAIELNEKEGTTTVIDPQPPVSQAPSPGMDGVGSLETLVFKLNQVLPPDITIQKIVPVKEEAHARFSPISRTYRYYITTKKPLYDRRYLMRSYENLDIEMMNHACAKLFCYEDFTSFSKLHTDVKTNNCKIMEAYWRQVEPDGERSAVNEATYVFTIKADRFLRNMVRAIVGTLIQVGRHRMTIKEFAEIIEKKNRCQAGDSVPACGLFLEEVEYPSEIFEV